MSTQKLLFIVFIIKTIAADLLLAYYCINMSTAFLFFIVGVLLSVLFFQFCLICYDEQMHKL